MKALLLVPLLLLGACASTASVSDAGVPQIPADAVEAVRTEANGDVVTEYRVGGQLRVVMVQPPRGPAYYLYDQDGQIRSSRDGDHSPQTYFRLFEW